ncbi:hypothetical protein [Pseudorhodoferax sp.]|uniref:hypothetical protein n=1 Tax=Pseudorhodoferax sp. TaxID=1993553 RepID=UPI0039E5FAC6
MRLLALAALLAAAWAERGTLADAWPWWFGGAAPTLARPLATLSPALDPAALAARLGAPPLRCQDTDAGRQCEGTVPAAPGGRAAATLQARWVQGRLAEAAFHLPWAGWQPAARALVAQLGAPTALDIQPPGAIVWLPPGGAVRLPQAPGWSPWQPVTVRWNARPAPG